MGRTASIGYRDPSYALAFSALNAIPAHERARILVGGGFATEIWMGGSGIRPTLDDIDLVLPIRSDGSKPADRLVNGGRVLPGSPMRTAFHSYSARIADHFASILQDVGASPLTPGEVVPPTLRSGPQNVIASRPDNTFGVDLLSAELIPIPVFQPSLSESVDVTLRSRVEGGSQAIRLRVPTPMTMVMWKLGARRLDSIPHPQMFRHEGGVKDLIDSIGLLQTMRRSDFEKYRERGVVDLDRWVRRAHGAQGVAPQTEDARLKHFATLVTDPKVQRVLRNKVAENGWEPKADLSGRDLRDVASKAVGMGEQLRARFADLQQSQQGQAL